MAAEKLTVVSAHPGVSMTQLQQVAAGANKYLRGWERGSSMGILQSVQDGCTPLLLAATGADVEPAAFYGPQWRLGMVTSHTIA